MKQVPDKDILLFRSCLVSVEYPGVESSTKFVFDNLGIVAGMILAESGKAGSIVRISDELSNRIRQ